MFPALGQLLDNSQGLAFTEYPYFNTQFVKASKIKTIKGTYTFKKQGDILRQSDFVYVYDFDSLGRLQRHYQTASGDLFSDTTVRFYTYDQAGYLRSLRVNQKSGFMTTYFTRDEKGRIVKEEVWRDIDTLHSLLEPDVERSILWNAETFQYSEYNGQFRKHVLNSYGNKYLELTQYMDSLGYLRKEEEMYTITRNVMVKEYKYTNKGWIASIESFSNGETTPAEAVYFTYDKYGNLESKQYYHNGKHITEHQIIYSGDTGMLSSVLIRDISTNYISIIRFEEPVFWDEVKQ